MTEDNSIWVAKENLFYAHCTWRYVGIIYPIAGLELTRARYKRPLADLDLHRLDINDWKFICSCVFYYVFEMFSVDWEHCAPTQQICKKQSHSFFVRFLFRIDYMHGIFLLSWTTMTM